MSTLQEKINSAAGSGISLFNLALNIGGLVLQRKNVSIWTQTGSNDHEVLTGAPNGSNIVNKLVNAIGANVVIMRASIEDTSQPCTYPLESGAQATDHIIHNPVKIVVEITMPEYLAKYSIRELKQYRDKRTFLSVHCHNGNEGIYNNMVITDIPHEETANRTDRITYNITLTQCLVVQNKANTISSSQVDNVSNSSTQDLGTKQAA